MDNDRQFLTDNASCDLFNGILDQLIPENKSLGVPSAGALNLIDFFDQVCTDNALTAHLFQKGMDRMNKLLADGGRDYTALNPEQRNDMVKQLEKQEPEFFESLLKHTYMAYYSRADVRASLGLSSRPTQPEGYEVPIETPGEMTALTTPVKKRGQCYRVC